MANHVVTTNCVICKATVEVDVRVFNDRPTARCVDCKDRVDVDRQIQLRQVDLGWTDSAAGPAEDMRATIAELRAAE